mmetsp:Transcript_13382/g.37950  ORF Transcript_13382/g.37950 Transcript_13382/m.37950 type:complete len:263 (+) Transcript_13382:784-1572(+)
MRAPSAARGRSSLILMASRRSWLMSPACCKTRQPLLRAPSSPRESCLAASGPPPLTARVFPCPRWSSLTSSMTSRTSSGTLTTPPSALTSLATSSGPLTKRRGWRSAAAAALSRRPAAAPRTRWFTATSSQSSTGRRLPAWTAAGHPQTLAGGRPPLSAQGVSVQPPPRERAACPRSHLRSWPTSRALRASSAALPQTSSPLTRFCMPLSTTLLSRLRLTALSPRPRRWPPPWRSYTCRGTLPRATMTSPGTPLTSSATCGS